MALTSVVWKQHWADNLHVPQNVFLVYKDIQFDILRCTD